MLLARVIGLAREKRIPGSRWRPAHGAIRRYLRFYEPAASSAAALSSTIPTRIIRASTITPHRGKIRLMSELTRLTIAQAREKMSAGEFTALELTDAYLSASTRPMRSSTPMLR